MEPVHTSSLWNITNEKSNAITNEKYQPLPIDVIGQHKIQTTERKRYLGGTIPRRGETHRVGDKTGRVEVKPDQRKKGQVHLKYKIEGPTKN